MVMWWSYGRKVDNQESLSELLDSQSIKVVLSAGRNISFSVEEITYVL